MALGRPFRRRRVVPPLVAPKEPWWLAPLFLVLAVAEVAAIGRWGCR